MPGHVDNLPHTVIAGLVGNLDVPKHEDYQTATQSCELLIEFQVLCDFSSASITRWKMEITKSLLDAVFQIHVFRLGFRNHTKPENLSRNNDYGHENLLEHVSLGTQGRFLCPRTEEPSLCPTHPGTEEPSLCPTSVPPTLGQRNRPSVPTLFHHTCLQCSLHRNSRGCFHGLDTSHKDDEVIYRPNQISHDRPIVQTVKRNPVRIRS